MQRSLRTGGTREGERQGEQGLRLPYRTGEQVASLTEGGRERLGTHDTRGKFRKGFGKERVTSSTQTLVPLRSGGHGWGAPVPRK